MFHKIHTRTIVEASNQRKDKKGKHAYELTAMFKEMKSTLEPENLNTSVVDEAKEDDVSLIRPYHLDEHNVASLVEQVEVLAQREE